MTSHCTSVKNLDTYYGVENYLEQLDAIAPEEPEIDSQSLFEKINSLITVESKGDELRSLVNRSIETLSKTNPGKLLFSRLLKVPVPIIIRTSEFASTKRFTPSTEFDWETITFKTLKVFIDIPKDHVIDPKLSSLFHIGLAHEFIHMLHHQENPLESRIRSAIKSGLLNPHFNDLEEQLTIFGVCSRENQVELCENAFRRAFTLPLRMDHN